MIDIAIYGGSFNPPHAGHVRAVNAARAQLQPHKLFLVPDYEPPHKELDRGSPSPAQRLELTRLMAQSIPGAETLDIEINRAGKSYTSDTLREIHAQYPKCRLCFLMGTDMFLTLDEWHEPEVITSLAAIGVFARSAGEREAIARKKAEVERRYSASVIVIGSEPIDISSSELRALLPRREGSEYLPDAVYGEIIRQRLYGAKPALAWLREKAYAHLKPKRMPHVAGTEQEAVRLAHRWGVDEGDAAEAAILHDITKRLDHEQQLHLCESYGIITDNLEAANEKLLHARTGAALSKELFGVPEQIESAIRWHTTGRAGMTRLEQIVYLADYIEPTRHGFAGLEQLRAAAYEDLDGAMALALNMSFQEVTEKGAPFHENSANAKKYYEALCKRKGLETVVIK